MEFKTEWPQMVWYVMTVIGFVLTTIQHGKTSNAGVGSVFIGIAIAIWIYYMGGYFAHIFWPHFVTLTIYGVALGVSMAGKGRQTNMFISYPVAFLNIYMLYLGGFLINH